MDSGLVTVGTNADMFNQLLSPAFNTPDAASTTQFLGSFGLSPQATQSATTAVLSGANPFASQAAMAPTLLSPLGAGSVGTVAPVAATATAAAAPATGLMSAGGPVAPAVSAESLMTHPALIAAVENFIATGGASAMASPLTPAYGYTPVTPAATPIVDPYAIPAAGGAPAGIGSVSTPPDAAAATPSVPAPADPAPAPATPAPATPAPATDAAAAGGGGEYVVKSGDTLTGIAKKNGIANWKEIYEIPENKDAIGSNPNLIKVGLKLKLPGGAAPAGGAATPATPAAAGPLTAEQRTQKQTELTTLDTQIQAARKELMDIYATIQPGSTPEQRVEGERKTAATQAKIDQMVARQGALRTELGLAPVGTAGTDTASFGIPASAA